MANAQSIRDIAAAVKGRRHDLGLSQDRLARQAGVSRKWISEFEAGKPTAELQLVLRVLDALGFQLRLDPADRTRGTGRRDAIDLDILLEGLGSPRAADVSHG